MFPLFLMMLGKISLPGKKFYKCQTGKENGGCDFFLWAPESADTGQNHYDTPPNSNSWGNASSSWGQSSGNSNARGWGITPSSSRDDNSANDDGATCNCGLPCKKYVVYFK